MFVPADLVVMVTWFGVGSKLAYYSYSVTNIK
jgi:hypothetical protein